MTPICRVGYVCQRHDVFSGRQVLVLEWVLGHVRNCCRNELLAYTFQMLQVAWLWILLGWTVGSVTREAPNRFSLSWFIMMFSAIEYLTRFQLAESDGTEVRHWTRSSAFCLLTKAELTEMKATSRELLSAVRWMVHGATLVWLSSLLACQGGVLPGDSSVSTWGRPTLWLASVYGLMFCSEAWLRLRGRWPNEHV